MHPQFNRREFVFVSLLSGLALTLPSRSVAQILKSMKFKVDKYKGPVFEKVVSLLERLDRNEITNATFVSELDKYYSQMDLKEEFATWIGNDIPDNGHDHKVLTRYEGPDRYIQLGLYIVPPRTSAPPHAHHNLHSTQTILKGELSIRQYDRVSRVDDTHVLIRPTRTYESVAGESLLMTETENNVHWFGTREKPALLFNLNVKGIPGARFDKNRKASREFLNPTGPIDANGLILAGELTSEEAFAAFEHKHPSDF